MELFEGFSAGKQAVLKEVRNIMIATRNRHNFCIRLPSNVELHYLIIAYLLLNVKLIFEWRSVNILQDYMLIFD